MWYLIYSGLKECKKKSQLCLRHIQNEVDKMKTDF